MTASALTLNPSNGRSGGIERNVETLEWAFAAQGVEYQRVDLRGTGIGAHARILARARELAVTALGTADIRVTVCSTGEPSTELERLVREHRCRTLRPGLNNRDLARQLAVADLFVLATRTRRGRHASGEGLGLVLLEAQVAGTPVIGAACGGSHEAYVERVTGATPTDETMESLAEVLAEVLRDPHRLAQMDRRAAEWARESFAPDQYASRAAGRLP